VDANFEKVEGIAKDFVNEVKKHISVNKAVIYGSYAKGHYNSKSDLDIAIFSESFKNKRFVDVTAFLFSVARKYKEVCIEPVGFADTDLKSGNPFIKEIISSGIEIDI
jgi:predicted nucleotidyltransferase